MGQLKIRIYPDGRVQAETNGIKGKTCTDYIRVLENMLSAEVVESAYTEEFYQSQIQEISETVVEKNNK